MAPFETASTPATDMPIVSSQPSFCLTYRDYCQYHILQCGARRDPIPSGL